MGGAVMQSWTSTGAPGEFGWGERVWGLRGGRTQMTPGTGWGDQEGSRKIGCEARMDGVWGAHIPWCQGRSWTGSVRQ